MKYSTKGNHRLVFGQTFIKELKKKKKIKAGFEDGDTRHCFDRTRLQNFGYVSIGNTEILISCSHVL